MHRTAQGSNCVSEQVRCEVISVPNAKDRLVWTLPVGDANDGKRNRERRSAQVGAPCLKGLPVHSL